MCLLVSFRGAVFAFSTVTNEDIAVVVTVTVSKLWLQKDTKQLCWYQLIEMVMEILSDKGKHFNTMHP